MFDKIFTKLSDYKKFKSNPDNFKYVEDFLIFIFFKDDRKFAEIEVKKLRKQVSSDEEFWNLFLKKYKFPDIFNSFEELAKMSNISSVISTLVSIKGKSQGIENYSEQDIQTLNRFADYYKSKPNDILEIVSEQLEIYKENLNEKYLKTKLFSTSKQSISDEFGVNKRTFNKWLEISGLGKKYRGEKKNQF